jgi:hypothetical protein
MTFMAHWLEQTATRLDSDGLVNDGGTHTGFSQISQGTLTQWLGRSPGHRPCGACISILPHGKPPSRIGTNKSLISAVI